MKAHDEAAWQQQVAELEADGETGQTFRRIVEAWAEEAEHLLDEERAVSPLTALRDALAAVEAKYGRIDTFFLGQMLVVLAAFWAHGEDFARASSPIERRLMEDTVILKMRQLAEAAANKETSDDKQ